jgi:uncharacterized protein YabN with tetrapyrrole methylase and pyrophosphatase domain
MSRRNKTIVDIIAMLQHMRAGKSNRQIRDELGVDAESALRGANLKFSQRFRRVEALVAERNLDWEQLDLAALEEIWEEVKGGTAV